MPAAGNACDTLNSHGSSVAGLPVLPANAAAAFRRCKACSMWNTDATASSWILHLLDSCAAAAAAVALLMPGCRCISSRASPGPKTRLQAAATLKAAAADSSAASASREQPMTAPQPATTWGASQGGAVPLLKARAAACARSLRLCAAATSSLHRGACSSPQVEARVPPQPGTCQGPAGRKTPRLTALGAPGLR